MYARTNGQKGRTATPSERASESAVRTSCDARPCPSKRGSVSVWMKAIRPGRRRYSVKPATSPSTRISKRDRSGTSTTRMSSGNPDRLECAGLGPADVQPALGEPPRTVRLGEGVLIADRGDHELALAVCR